MTNFKPRPTTYNGIEMRSRLEAGYAAWLDQWGFNWEYEPRAFASDAGQYLPDFRLRDVPEARADGQAGSLDIYVEVKSAGAQVDMDALGRRMQIIESSTGFDQIKLLLEVPGLPPREWIRGSQDRPGSWHEVAWVYCVAWDDDPYGKQKYSEYLAIATVLGRDLAPWPHGYWNGPG